MDWIEAEPMIATAADLRKRAVARSNFFQWTACLELGTHCTRIVQHRHPTFHQRRGSQWADWLAKTDASLSLGLSSLCRKQRTAKPNCAGGVRNPGTPKLLAGEGGQTRERQAPRHQINHIPRHSDAIIGPGYLLALPRSFLRRGIPFIFLTSHNAILRIVQPSLRGCHSIRLIRPDRVFPGRYSL